MLKALMNLHPDAAGTGLEVSPQAVALAERVVPTGDFKTCDVSTDSLDQTFDLVVSADVVEHID